MSEGTSERGLREVVEAAAAELTGASGGGARPRAEIGLERPPKPGFGDYSTNAALLLAPALGEPPRELAQRLGGLLAERLGGGLERFEVAGPGFLNLFLGDGWHLRALAGVLGAGEAFGRGGEGAPERILVEFVSANPTGPMHVGHARNAAYGDSLARVLAFHGHRVEREFYVNDAGSQVLKLGETIRALARGEEVPEGGYRGEYVPALVAEVQQRLGVGSVAELEPAALGAGAVAAMIAHVQSSLHAFRVQSFDHWAYETTLHEPREDLVGEDGGPASAVEHSLALLERSGHTYRSDGALWLRSTDFGDDKDRVLVRSSGEHTYFASDVAYHQDKRERGFQRQIDVWGADHHGYIARMKAAYQALGGDPAHLEMLIMQLVHLVRRGERAQMSKRAGEFVTLDDLLAEIGVDAARWFLLSRSHDTTIDLDLDLAREQSAENPVYYVQYAHARIASVLQRAGAERVERALAQIADAGEEPTAGAGGEAEEAQRGLGASDALQALIAAAALDPAERALVKQLLAFPGEVAAAAERRAPHRIAAYALLLAQTFTAFYRDCRVLEAEPAELEDRRLGLCVAAQLTIAAALELLGVSAPERM
ncbi:MAG TPA: arginine--tRNA ligase [Solirubrobacteraceae bacterium]|nr:arginine--tRNA ligase [Solirubrobacteraceae bacterium]